MALLVRGICYLKRFWCCIPCTHEAGLWRAPLASTTDQLLWYTYNRRFVIPLGVSLSFRMGNVWQVTRWYALTIRESIWSDLIWWCAFLWNPKKKRLFGLLALDLSVVFVSNGICPEMWIIVVHLDLNTVNNFFGGGGGGGNVHRLWHNWEEVSSQWRGMDASLAQSSKWNMTRVWTSSLLLCAPFCRYR